MAISYSQAGQDIFALYMMRNRALPKTYLDIGCQNPIQCNNSYLLEQNGWCGVSIDIEDYHEQYKEHRRNPFCQANVTIMDWDILFYNVPFYQTNTIDYLSFDVDDATYYAFLHFPFDKVRFNVITIEHDAYRVGNNLKKMIRERLTSFGYTLLCADVTLSGYGAFEDWWVDIENIDTTLVSKVQSIGKNYLEICESMIS